MCFRFLLFLILLYSFLANAESINNGIQRQMFENGNPKYEISYKNKLKPDAKIWNRESNYYAWKFYLKNFKNEKKIPIYAAPHRAKNLTKLPPAFIGVGSKDLFFEENLKYAKKLVKSGVKTECHIYANGYHGFDSSAPNAEISKRFKKDMFAVLKKEI